MPAASIRPLRDIIADDAHAAAFETIGQYRTALLAHIDSPGVEFKRVGARHPVAVDHGCELKNCLCQLLQDNTGVSPLRSATLVDTLLAYVRLHNESPAPERAPTAGQAPMKTEAIKEAA